MEQILNINILYVTPPDIYSEADLIYDDYKKSPSDCLFDCYDANQVLLVINTLFKEWDIKNKLMGKKLEEIIRTKLPSNCTTIKDVTVWFKTNQNKLNLE